jgi:Deoxyribonuclease NucA/NucB
MTPARRALFGHWSGKPLAALLVGLAGVVLLLGGSEQAGADVNGTITVGGSGVTVTLASGESARLTFSGTQGQRIAVRASSVTLSPTSSYETLRLLKPDGTNLPASVIVGSGSSGGGFLEPQALPTTGTYTVLLTPPTGTSGTTTLTAYDVPADVSQSIAADGSATTVSTSTPGQNAVLSFSGSAGQRVYVKASGFTYSPYATINLRGPTGSTLGSGVSASIDTKTLPSDGSYTILVDPAAAATGSGTLRLYTVPTDSVTPVAVIPTTGNPTDFSLPIPGSAARFTFSGAAGQKVSIKTIGSTIAFGDFKLLKPDGTQQASTWFGSGDRTMDTQTLANAGTYTVLLDPNADYTGGGRLAVYEVPQDITQAVSFGTATNVNASAPGMKIHLTFAGTAGHRVSVQMANSTIQWGTLRLRKPDASEITNTWFSTGAKFIDSQTLPVSGTYTVDVEPDTGMTGTATVTVYDVPADFAASVTPTNAGAATSISLATPGQNAELSFSGQAGQRIFTKLAGSTYNWGTLSLIGPAGTTFASTWFSTGEQRIDTFTLPSTGSYRVRLDPDREYIGAANLTLYDVPPDQSGSLSYSDAFNVSLPVPGMKARLTFAGSQGQRILLSTKNSTVTFGSTKILKPDGSELSSTYLATGEQLLDTQTLPATGTYTVFIQPDAAYTGAVDVRLYDVPADIADSLDVDGAPRQLDLAVGQNARLSFQGIGGEQLELTYPNALGDNFGTVAVDKPDGSELAHGGIYSGGSISLPVLPTSGTYSVRVDPRGTGTGSLSLSLRSLGLGAKPITPDGPPVSAEVIRNGGSAKLTFSGIQGQRMSVTTASTTIQGGTIALLAPDGSSLQQDALAPGAESMLDAVMLPATGSYTILVSAAAWASGTTSVSLHDVSSDVFATLPSDGSSIPISIAKPGQNAILSFSADPNTVARLTLTASTIAGGTLTVRNAAGDPVASSAFDGGGTSLDTAALVAGGNYTLLVDPRRTNTGSFSASLSVRPAGAPGRIVPSGPKISAGWSGLSDDAGLVFDANPGDRISLVVSDYTMASGSAQVLRPDGSEFASWPIVDGQAFIDVKTVTVGGTYTVRIAQRPAGSGRARFALYSVPDRAPVPLALDGDPLQIEAGVPGENRRLSFSAQAGQTISLQASAGTISFASLRLYSPGGAEVANSWTTETGFLDATRLETSGTYELVLDPSGPATGAVTLKLHLVPTPAPAAIEASGETDDPSGLDVQDEEDALDPNDPDSYPGEFSVALSTPGENGEFAFSGSAGERVTVLVRNSTLPLASVRILAPDGSEVGSHAAGQGKSFVDPLTLPEAGTYTLVYDPASDYTGTAALMLFDVPPTLTGQLNLNAPISIDVLVPGQTARFGIDGEAGQHRQIRVISRDIPAGTARLEKIDGTNLDSSYFDDDLTERILNVTLDTTGHYTFVLDPADSGTGTAEVWMTDPDAPPDAGGDPGDPGDADPIGEDVPDDGTACDGSDPADPCNKTLEIVSDDDLGAPPAGVRTLAQSGSPKARCSLINGGIPRGSYTGRWGWSGTSCFVGQVWEEGTNGRELVGEAAIEVKHRVELRRTTAHVTGWARITTAWGWGDLPWFFGVGGKCIPWGGTFSGCPFDSSVPLPTHMVMTSLLSGWTSVGSDDVRLSAQVDPGQFRVGLVTAVLGPAPPPAVAVRPLPSPTIRCEIMNGPVTPNTGASCVFPGVRPQVVFSRSEAGYKKIAAHMYYAINTLNKPSILHRYSALKAANRQAAGCYPGGPWLPKLTGYNCDEYPFASTEEGGAGSSIRGVPEKENSRQGGRVNIFFTNNHVLDHAPGRRGEDFKVKVR